MNNKLKRLLSVFLSVMLVFSLTVPTMASDIGTVQAIDEMHNTDGGGKYLR